jgi:hypothetical protein
MNKLIPLSTIPVSARKAESEARAKLAAEALEAASYRIEVAPGCHGRPHFDPPVLGWVCTREAAEALSARLTHMPDHSSHRRTSYSVI